jgi:hypothetical protein
MATLLIFNISLSSVLLAAALGLLISDIVEALAPRPLNVVRVTADA